MVNLPDDIIKNIFSFLGLRHLANMALINRRFYTLTREKMSARDQIKEYISVNENLSHLQINYLLSNKIYFEIKGKKLTIELAMSEFNEFFKNETMRWNALRYQTDVHKEEQKQQFFAMSKGYLDTKLLGLSSFKRRAILQHDLSWGQVKNLSEDQAKLIVEDNVAYDNVKNLKAYQVALLKNGWTLEMASQATVMQARVMNKRKYVEVADDLIINLKK